MMASFRALLAAGMLMAGLLPGQGAATPAVPVESMYADAVAKESAVHTALNDVNATDVVLKAVRTVVSDYEAIVRAFPASGYSDDALWRGGLVSLDAFNRFADPHDRETAIRLLRQLASQYPTSRLARYVPEVLASISLAPSPGRPAQRAAAAGSAAVAAPHAPPPVPAPASAGVPVAAKSPANPARTPAGANADTGAPRLSTITSIKRTTLQDTVRVTIDLDFEVPFHEERIDGPPRIFVDFSSSKALPTIADKTLRFDSDSDPVHQIRIGRHPDNTTRVVLDAVDVDAYSVYPLYNPYRLVIDCVKAAAGAAASRSTATIAAVPVRPGTSTIARTGALRPVGPPALKARALVPDLLFSLVAMAPYDPVVLHPGPDGPDAVASTVPTPAAPAGTGSQVPAPDHNLTGGFSIARQLGLGVSRIVIDPGHGGHDPGAQGKTGVSEAELVLDVALRLEKLLQKVPGVDVILTRRTDDFVPLQERTAIANREGADLFLSIHANASSSVLTHGVETYYLDFASTLDSAAVAVRENAASGQAMGGLPDFIKSIALNNKLDESRDFATDVQRAMIERLRTVNKTVKDLGVKQAPFMVLIGAAMPSVLAEISFVTNDQEARFLKGSVYRQRIAEALFNAIRKYQTSLRGVETAARQP